MDKFVIFTETQTVKDHLGATVKTFEAGRIYQLNPLSAVRWIRRRVAEETTEEAAVAQAVADSSPSPEAPESEPQPAPKPAPKKRGRKAKAG